MNAKNKPTTAPGKRRILLVDDHAIVREGFAELINGHNEFQVCGTVATAGEALDAVAHLKPDLVVTDLSLERGSGLDLIKNLKALHPLLTVLVLSMHDETLYAERALRAGALGYVMKRAESATVLSALRTVLDGQVFLSPAMRERMLQKVVGLTPSADATGMAHLSDREMEVFQLIGQGRTTRQISKQLHLGVSTIETHRAHLKEKLNLANSTELIRRAVEWVSQH